MQPGSRVRLTVDYAKGVTLAPTGTRGTVRGTSAGLIIVRADAGFLMAVHPNHLSDLNGAS